MKKPKTTNLFLDLEETPNEKHKSDDHEETSLFQKIGNSDYQHNPNFSYPAKSPIFKERPKLKEEHTETIGLFSFDDENITETAPKAESKVRNPTQ